MCPYGVDHKPVCKNDTYAPIAHKLNQNLWGGLLVVPLSNANRHRAFMHGALSLLFGPSVH
jgi:hypothetical protein